MKKIIFAILTTGLVVSTICFRACKKRVDITNIFKPKVVDDDWEHIIELNVKDLKEDLKD